MTKIYIAGEKPQTIEELIKRFYSYPISQSIKSITTYVDKECTITQCNENKYRSFDDLLCLINTYFEGTTPKELMTVLLNTKIDGKVFFSMFCYGIKKSVTCFNHLPTDNINKDKGMSEYSWKELYKMVGIKTSTELREHFIKLNTKKDEKVQIDEKLPF